MSVDPDDRTPGAIKQVEQTLCHGPVLPGAMFLLDILILNTYYGLPGCVMYANYYFDLILPRVAAGIKVSRKI